jgi:hypothetical protein
MEIKINDWTGYWNYFDRLCAMRKDNNKEDVVAQLRKAQLYVNGLTDGWFEFLYSFEEVIKNNKGELTKDEKELAEKLIALLRKSIKL